MTAISPTLRSQRISVDPGFVLWLTVMLFCVACLLLRNTQPWIAAYPADWLLPLSPSINVTADWLVRSMKPLTAVLTVLFDVPMRAVQAALQWLPWPAAMLLVGVVSLKVGGPRLAFFAVVSLSYFLLTGFWKQSMNTLALVLLSVPISALIGFALGVSAYVGPAIRKVLEAVLDLMQTVPAFAYLIPLLLLFGFGPVVGLIASAIYSVPPMVRNTLLGLNLVPSDVKDAGDMGGCTPWQRFWLIDVPTAMPQILVGLNQTTMAALSMVIIASIIGGFEDIGWEVLSSMRKAEFGQSLLSGVVIVLIAILIDRITLGIAKMRASASSEQKFITSRTTVYVIAVALSGAIVWQYWSLPGAGMSSVGESRIWIGGLNKFLLEFVALYGEIFDAIRNAAFYALILPLRVGIFGAATPAIWGFSLTPAHTLAYAAFILAVAIFLAHRVGWRPAVAVFLAGAILSYGFLGFPWPALLAIVGLLAFRVAGLGMAIFAIGGLGLILINGLWIPLMQSLYLCGIAVVLCVLIGGALGLWAAHDDRVSTLLRPINDALQTMPQFVFLIPALMLFKVGEFTALLAIMLYAIVPPIRYVEHGLRSVRPDVIEAVRQMGSTPGQVLWIAKLPLALPVIMLGVNQTIMAALSMLAIAAMVGTRDLGQQVYLALGKADPGLGLIAGLSIAFLAIVSDRLIQTWSHRQRLGNLVGL